MYALLALWLGMIATPLFGSTEPGWMAFGDIRGNVAPCGCDPLTDLGGVRRLSRFVQETRKHHPDVVLFSLGENFPLKSEPEKAQAIHDTLLLLKPDALLWRGEETKSPVPGQLPYVLSHSQKLVHGVQESRIAGPWLVLGFHEDSPKSQPYGPRLEKSWRKLIASHPDKKTILLFAGKLSTLERIEKSRLFSEIISANTSPRSAEPTQIEKEEPGRLFRSGAVYMVPSFGQGILRGGSLRTVPRLNLPGDCKPASLEPRCLKKPSLLGGDDNLLTWLDLTWQGASPADGIFANYNRGAEHVFMQRALARAKDLKGSPYIGSATCGSCHAKAYAAWEKSKHAHAWNTLKAKDKHQDSECVSCHVLGYEQKGGFADMQTSPQFANVQCESCHGPRRAHTSNPSIKPPQDPRAACAGCHTPPHSPRFDMESYWQQIKH